MGASIGSYVAGAAQVGLAVDQYGADTQAAVTQFSRDKTKITAAEIDARTAGDFAQMRARLSASQLAGQQRVAYAGSGVDVTRGTAAQVQANTMAMGEFNAQIAANNSARQIWGLAKARQWAQEDMAQRVGNASRKEWAGILGGMSKFAGGGSDIGGGGGGGDSSSDSGAQADLAGDRGGPADLSGGEGG